MRETPLTNSAPEYDAGITLEVDENTVEGGKVGAPVMAMDADMDVLRYTITGGADMGSFKIGRDSGQVSVGPGTDLDFEGGQTTYVIEVKAEDPFGLSDSTTVTIEVQNVNEAPDLMLVGDVEIMGEAAVDYEENGTGDVATYTSPTGTDWSLSGDDAGLFDITGGVLTFMSPPDFEAPADADTDNAYEVTVEVRDRTVTASMAVTVTVTNVLEITGETAVDYEENGTEDVATYTSAGDMWSLSGDDAGLFDITGGVLTFMSSPDFEAPADADTDNAYEVTVEVSDGDMDDMLDVTVTVTNAQEIEITGEAAVDYEENGTGDVATYTSTGDMWSLSGDDAGLFDITGGVLTFMASPDFEAPADADTDNAYEVTVEVGDSDGTDAASMAVTVTVTNEQEIVITGSTASDHKENGTEAVGTYTSSVAGVTWSLSGPDADDFTISGGVLEFTSPPDFEAPTDADADNVYMVTVTAIAEGADDGVLDVAVTVTDMDEVPPAVEVTGSTASDYEENGTGAVGTYTSSEAGATWSLSGEDMDDFSISSDGVLSFMSSPDFEAPTDADADNVYMVTVTAMAEGADDGSLDVAVTVTDVDEVPPAVEVTGSTASTTRRTAREPSGRTHRPKLARPGRCRVKTWTTSRSAATACSASCPRLTSRRRQTRTPTTFTW